MIDYLLRACSGRKVGQPSGPLRSDDFFNELLQVFTRGNAFVARRVPDAYIYLNGQEGELAAKEVLLQLHDSIVLWV